MHPTVFLAPPSTRSQQLTPYALAAPVSALLYLPHHDLLAVARGSLLQLCSIETSEVLAERRVLSCACVHGIRRLSQDRLVVYGQRQLAVVDMHTCRVLGFSIVKRL